MRQFNRTYAPHEAGGHRTVSSGSTTRRNSRRTCRSQLSMEQQMTSRVGAAAFIKAVHGVRYQVTDVARAVAFYTQRLRFTLKHQQLPAFANVSLGGADILLSRPGASGPRRVPTGEHQTSGGWNRVVLRVADLPACIAALQSAGVTFRNEMEV